MLKNKLKIVEEKKVIGNLQAHEQTYSFIFLPKHEGLAEKLELMVKTDVFNSLRFQHDSQFFEFLADALFSLITFRELKNNPINKEHFRIVQLNDSISKLQENCIRRWKEQVIKIEYQENLNH